MDQQIEKWIERYQQGDAEAIDLLVDRLSPILFRFFVSLGANRPEAEDLLQETWLRLHKARQTYRAGAPALPWIFAIARHTRLDYLRRMIRVRQNELQVDILPERPVEPKEDEEVDILPLLALLPESQREAVVMTKLSGMSLEEVAQATGSTVGAVKQKVFRAYEKLRALTREKGLTRG